MSSAWQDGAQREQRLGQAMSFQEWTSLPPHAMGELVAGHLTEEEVPDPLHELAVSWLVFLLRSWLGREGFVFGSDLKVQLSDETGRKPDVTVILPGRGAPARHGPLRVVPDIVVEVITPTPRDERRDRVEKMSEYEARGVRWYWLLDPALGTLEIFEVGAEGRYIKALAATGGKIANVPGCPGLTIDLDDLWAELDRLSD